MKIDIFYITIGSNFRTNRWLDDPRLSKSTQGMNMGPWKVALLSTKKFLERAYMWYLQ